MMEARWSPAEGTCVMSETDKSGNRFQVSPRLWLGLVIAAVAVVFILQNRQAVEVSLFFQQLSAPLWTALAGVFLAGLVTGWLLARRGK